MRWYSLAVAAASITGVLVPTIRAQQPGVAPASARDSTRVAAVTYISGQSVYVGAGRADGVREGMSLEVLRAGAIIATIRATYLSSHSSACEIVASTGMPNVGDSVRYHPVVERAAVVIAGTDSSRAETESYRRTPWQRPIRGHVGLRYLSVSQPNAPGLGSLSQPSADVYVEATEIGGTPIGLVIDGRSRRTIGASQVGAHDERTLIYQVSLSAVDPGSGARLSVGRQYSTALSSVSLFDGVTVELNRSRWGMGAFGGVQPDVATMGYSTDIREAGGYVQLHNEPGGSMPWSMTTGAVSSRDLGQLNRDFGFAQIALSSSSVSLYATQEVDVNRGWKLTAGEPAVSPTSTFATLTIRPTEALSFQAGVDNRRNVRLYRDYVSPETEFDDAFREGVWGGAGLVLLQTIRIGGDARFSRGGSAGDAAYYTGTLGLGPVSPFRIDAHLRSTNYTADSFSGWMHAVSASVEPFSLVRLEVNGGLRSQRMAASGTALTGAVTPLVLANTQWIGASVDVSLARSWYVLVSGTRDGAGTELTNQLYGSIVFRF